MSSMPEVACDDSGKERPVRKAILSTLEWCCLLLAAGVGWGSVVWLVSRALTR